jgi:chemotaxis protein MotB
LSADRANAAREIMQENGLRPDQVTQVRGFADQQLRDPAKPGAPSNRRVSIIVQFPQEAEPEPPPTKGEKKPSGAAKPGEGKAPENPLPAPKSAAEKPPEHPAARK